MHDNEGNSRSVAARIRRRLGRLTPTERRPALALLANYPVAGLETVAQFAARAKVSGPTILRLIAKLGFDSYPDFQQALRDELELRLLTPLAKAPPEPGHPSQGDFLSTYTRAIIENIETSIADLPRAEFEAAVALLADPRRRILLLGGRFTSSLAIHLYLHLRELRPRVQLVEGQTATWAEHLLDLGRNDVLVVFDIRRFQEDVVLFAREAAAGGNSCPALHRHLGFAGGSGGRPRLFVAHHHALLLGELRSAVRPVGGAHRASACATLEGQQAAYGEAGTAARASFGRGDSAMISEPIALVCTCEIAGRVRGKGFPVADLSARLKSGVGWVPTNTMISALGPIADTPFGATGDLILVPDPATELKVDFEDGSAPEHFFLGDIRTTAGAAWECCPRDFLRRGLAALKGVAGLELYSAFEQEFVYTGVEDHPGSPYSLESFRRQGRFGGAVLAALRAAGLEPDSFLPEYGARQYEVTTGPANGVAAADNAIKMREIARAVAHRLGHRAIFSPILDPDGTGNGVHVHMSLRTADNRPATHDPARPYGLAPAAEAFVAGVLSHMGALVAVTAPNPVSYIRLTPNRWAPTWAYLAERDREASLRVCPVLDLPGFDPAGQFNIEFRPADAAASPYLALGAIVWAGVDGIAKGLGLPPPRNVAAMPPEERRAAGIAELPHSLGEALELLKATAEAKDWFGRTYLDAYLRHKRAEIAMVADLTEKEKCARYAESY